MDAVKNITELLALIIYIFISGQLYAQEQPMDLNEIYPPDRLLNQQSLIKYGEDIKKMLTDNRFPEALEHVDHYFYPQLTHYSETFPEALTPTLVWVNHIYSTSSSHSGKSTQTGEMYLSLVEQYPNQFKPEEKFNVLWRTGIAYRKISKLEKSQTLIDNGFKLLNDYELRGEVGLKGNLFIASANLRLEAG
ncbi:MAG: hypothetical protein HRU12_06140, partial [Phaeodactylibacter sp.]|nr:hypothetical protein [Phaeodactylibacter sp.]